MEAVKIHPQEKQGYAEYMFRDSMPADDFVTQEARVSTGMILTYQ